MRKEPNYINQHLRPKNHSTTEEDWTKVQKLFSNPQKKTGRRRDGVELARMLPRGIQLSTKLSTKLQLWTKLSCRNEEIACKSILPHVISGWALPALPQKTCCCDNCTHQQRSSSVNDKVPKAWPSVHNDQGEYTSNGSRSSLIQNVPMPP